MAIRNLAISGVNLDTKAENVCRIVRDIAPNGEPYASTAYNSRHWFFDDGDEKEFMYTWDTQEEHRNFEKCTQMTYEEFLEKYDKSPMKFEL